MGSRRLRTRVVAALGAAALVVLVAGEGTTASARPTPPSVTTEVATSVRANLAVLNGTLTAGGPADVSFEWGTTTSYGSQTAVISGFSGGPFHATLTGLQPGTTYHFRARATSSTPPAAVGGDQTFTTPSAPTVSTGGAMAPHGASVVVSGTANPHGFATTVAFEYGTSTNYSKATSPTGIGSGTSTIPFNGTLTGLAPGATYHYRAVATSQNGTTYGNDRTVTIAGTPTVITVGATAIQAISATLSGTANPAGSSMSVSFEYGTSTSYGGTTAPKSIGSGGTMVGFHAPITNLTPGATYHYRAVATNASGTIYGSDKTFTTTKKPTLITGGAADITNTTVTLNGVVNPSGSATSVSFEYGTEDTYGLVTGAQQIAGGLDPVPFSAKLTGLTPGTTYHFRAQGTSASGTGVGADLTFTTTGSKPSSSVSPTATPTSAPTVTAHPKPTGFDPLVLAGGVGLGVLLLGGFAVIALARSRR